LVSTLGRVAERRSISERAALAADRRFSSLSAINDMPRPVLNELPER